MCMMITYDHFIPIELLCPFRCAGIQPQTLQTSWRMPMNMCDAVCTKPNWHANLSCWNYGFQLSILQSSPGGTQKFIDLDHFPSTLHPSVFPRSDVQDIGFEVASASSQKEAWLQKEAACRLPNVKVHSKVKGNLIASILEVAYYGITSWNAPKFIRILYGSVCTSSIPGSRTASLADRRPAEIRWAWEAWEQGFGMFRPNTRAGFSTITIGPHIFFDIIMFS